MNVLNAIGNINKPELRYLPDQTPVLQFSFALNSGYGDKQVTTWLNCSLFGKRSVKISEYLSTGNQVGITGELVNRKYQDKNGNDKYSLECRLSDLTLLSQREGGKERNNQPQAQESGFNDYVESQDVPF